MSEDKMEKKDKLSRDVELKRRISELEARAKSLEEEARGLQEQKEFAMTLVTATPHPVVVVNPDLSVRYVNPAFEHFTGFTSGEVLGMGTPRPWWDEGHIDETASIMRAEVSGRKKSDMDVPIRTKQGVRRWIQISVTPVSKDGEVLFSLINWTDVTERRLAMETVRRQSEDILELSTPVMQVWKGVLVAPLVGSFDSMRAELFTERVLQEITDTSSDMVLVDITGVPAVDTQTAQHLIDTMTAAKLLGTEVVLTGVRPAIAQTLVHLGIDLSGIVTRSSLAAGLQYALGKMGQFRK
ncbi:MAG: PAS domain S-box protein [Dehalococcoidia bacterium]|nr:PAS domain S-box protein [Dehalococcoidia bacterium]